METLNGTGADRSTYFKMFARHGARLDINLCLKVFGNRHAFVAWPTETKGYGWSLCIFLIEISVPDNRVCMRVGPKFLDRYMFTD